MSKKSLDSGVLGALHILSEKPLTGVHYLEFVKDLKIMNGVQDLIEKNMLLKNHKERMILSI